MARRSERLPENAPGEFFVDRSCIDCGVCWLVAPEVFARSRRQLSHVQRQPKGPSERHRALMALVACPSGSIGTEQRLDASAAAGSFPLAIADEVYFCGFAARSSFGAASYLIARPEGNLLIDSPRGSRPLFERLEALGGVRWLLLTHRDDVADHARYHERFGCERVLHADEVSADTLGVERTLLGREPIRLAADLLAIPVPGHTRGSVAYLYRDSFLFTGDHLYWDSERSRLDAGRSVCWYSWSEQTESMERLLAHRFEWVLPGHGGWWHAPSPEQMRGELKRLVARMRRGVSQAMP